MAVIVLLKRCIEVGRSDELATRRRAQCAAILSDELGTRHPALCFVLEAPDTIRLTGGCEGDSTYYTIAAAGPDSYCDQFDAHGFCQDHTSLLRKIRFSAGCLLLGGLRPFRAFCFRRRS